LLQFHEIHDEGGILRVADLAGEIWREYYPTIISPDQVEYMLAKIQSPEAIGDQVQNHGLRYFLTLEDDREAGYLAVIPRGDDLFISKLYLKADCRGKGLSREMLAFIESQARAAGCSRMTLTTHKQNEVALRAYQGLGFKILEPVVTDIGGGYMMDDYRLAKAL